MAITLYYLPLERHGFDLDLDEAQSLLDERESQRYRRFKNERAQRTFLQARRIVKSALAERLNCAPKDICFCYTDTEKPLLHDNDQWHFNISHSHEVIIVALAEQPVGVDVEDVKRCASITDKAGEFLHAHAQRQVDQARSAYGRAATFAEQWCLTESYIKLHGSAIYRDKDRVIAEERDAFADGRQLCFEDTHFLLLTFAQNIRCALAVNGLKEHEVLLQFWRTGQIKRYAFST